VIDDTGLKGYVLLAASPTKIPEYDSDKAIISKKKIIKHPVKEVNKQKRSAHQQAFLDPP
jgi:hypothetical protein